LIFLLFVGISSLLGKMGVALSGQTVSVIAGFTAAFLGESFYFLFKSAK
jgi:hypothetical protein